MLDELNGIYSILNFDLEKLLYYFLTDEILYYQRILEYYRNKMMNNKACTIFAYRSNNNLFVGRNYDWLPEVENIFQLYKVNNFKSYKYVALTDMGIASAKKIEPKYQIYQVDDAINEKGLFIGITFAYANNLSSGILPTHVTKIVAEKCSTLDDAINIFRNVPVAVPKNFFIADKFGNVAIVEHMSSYKFKIVYPKENILN